MQCQKLLRKLDYKMMNKYGFKEMIGNLVI